MRKVSETGCAAVSPLRRESRQIWSQTVSRCWLVAWRDLAGEALDAADSMVKFESTMSFAGFSDAEIDEMSKQAQEYASRTVYDLQTVTNTIAQLGANGVKDYADLTEAAGNLNAVAGGSADTSKASRWF